MYGGPFERVVLHQDGSPLVNENIDTFHMAFEGSKVQRCVSLCGSHIQVQQRLNQDFQRLVMPMVCLKTNVMFLIPKLL